MRIRALAQSSLVPVEARSRRVRLRALPRSRRRPARALDRWRAIYNLDRPHEALGQDAPTSRYRPSRRPTPDRLPEVEHDDHEIVRAVSTTKAYVSFKGRLRKVPQAFCGERLAILPLATHGRYGVFFAAHQIATIDLTNNQTVNQASAMSSD